MPVWSGILIALASTTIMNAGLALQKRGVSGLPRLGEEKGAAKALFKNRTWLLGLGGLLLGWGLYLFSTKIAPISLVQPTLGMGLAVLALFSVLYLKERIKPIEWVSLACMIAGMVLLGLSATEETTSVPPRWPLLLIVTATILAVSTLAFTLSRRGKLSGVRADSLLGIISGLFIGIGALYTRAMFLSLDNEQTLAGLLVCLPVLIAANIIGIGILQSGFQHGKALVVVALEAVLNKVVAIVGGIAALGEHLPASSALATMRIAAFVLILFGCVFLSRFGEEEPGEQALEEETA